MRFPALNRFLRCQQESESVISCIDFTDITTDISRSSQLVFVKQPRTLCLLLPTSPVKGALSQLGLTPRRIAMHQIETYPHLGRSKAGFPLPPMAQSLDRPAQKPKMFSRFHETAGVYMRQWV